MKRYPKPSSLKEDLFDRFIPIQSHNYFKS